MYVRIFKRRNCGRREVGGRGRSGRRKEEQEYSIDSIVNDEWKLIMHDGV